MQRCGEAAEQALLSEQSDKSSTQAPSEHLMGEKMVQVRPVEQRAVLNAQDPSGQCAGLSSGQGLVGGHDSLHFMHCPSEQSFSPLGQVVPVGHSIGLLWQVPSGQRTKPGTAHKAVAVVGHAMPTARHLLSSHFFSPAAQAKEAGQSASAARHDPSGQVKGSLSKHDTASLQACMVAAQEPSGQRIRLPPHVFMVGQSLFVFPHCPVLHCT
jgi:hypothetical protein